MSRSKRFEDDFDDAAFYYDDDTDVKRFLDSMIERSVKRRHKRKNRARQYLDDLEDRRWLRQHLEDWDTDSIQ